VVFAGAWVMGKKHKKIIIIVMSVIVISMFLSIYITVEETMPSNAVVVVTLEDKLYHSIHFDYICVEGKTAKTMTLSEALAKGYKPHKYDQELGYFKGNRCFLFHHVLSKLGVRVNSRWDKEGNWLW
jgi:hypothetical protein